MITLPGILHHSSKSVAIEPPPKPPVDVLKSAITFLGIRRRRISVLNNAPIEICREIIKMNFCRLKPANKEITDDEFLELISKVHSLTSVNLSGCWKLTEKSVQVLAQRFPSLVRVKCDGKISDIETLSEHCPHLKQIELTDSFFPWTLGSWSILGNLQELTALSFGSSVNYSMQELKILIERLPKLKKYSGRVNNDVLFAMANHCHSLTDLNIWGEDEDLITDDAFERLALQCPNIRSISLEYCDEISGKTLSAFQNLESVKVISCDGITGSGIIRLTEKCKNLKSLTLDDVSVIDESLHDIARNCSTLQSISVKGCASISDRSVIPLTEHCKKLKSINVWGDITDETVFAINQNLDDIRRLNFFWCNISDDSMVPFAQKHTRVIDLCLSNTRITDKTLFALAKYCHDLVAVNLQKTHITENGIVALIENCPHLRACYIGGAGKFQVQVPFRTKYPHIKFGNFI